MNAARLFVALWLRIIAIAVTNVAIAWTVLGCAPSAIHVATADSTSFQRMLEADTDADARRAAMWMEPRARRRLSRQATVLDNDKLPEAYTLDGERGRWASQFHLSYAALRLMRAFYAATHPAYRQFESDDLVDVVDEAGGNTHSVNTFERDRQLDIADVEGRFVFEVVPPGPTHEAAGKKKVDWELLLLNKAMLGVPEFTLGTGYSGEIGVRFAEDALPWKVVWSTTAPGVIAFRWQVLSASERSEEAYSEAYLDNRWHDPTTYETTRFGRALHQVVEKLVQAREALGQTRAATKMPLLPGKTIADYLRSVVLWSDHDDKIARLLPVMRELPPLPPRLQVRRDARFVGQTVGGGSGGDPPGGYTVKGRPGNQPWPLHMGNAAHNIIGQQYKTQHVGHEVFTNTVSIKTIVEEAGGQLALLRADEALKRPDITDLEARVVFEIKSSAEGQLEEAKAKVAKDIAAINRTMPPKLFTHGSGFSGDFWVRFALGMPYWRLNWSTTSPGVIQYKWSQLNNGEVDEAKITKGIEEGRYTWVNLTEADMQQYAEKCEKFSQMYTVGATRLHTIQMVTDVVVGIIGEATIIYLSPGLGPGKKVQPGALPQPRPTLTTPAGQPVPVPRLAPGTRVPAGPPPVNAPSLGSDSRSIPRPAAPGKTPAGPTSISPN